MADGKLEPLLNGPEQADTSKADSSRCAGQAASSGAGGGSAEHTVWEGTTWQGCPDVCCCCSPVCCSNWHWHITEQRIDLMHGCCGSSMETLDLRRIIDLHFHRSLWQMCCGRGTIVIHSDNDEFPRLNLTTFGTRDVFERLKQAWTKARIATAVHHGEHEAHHLHV